jgi:hypothetical protein
VNSGDSRNITPFVALESLTQALVVNPCPRVFTAHVGICFAIVNVLLVVIIVWGWETTDERRVDISRASMTR